MATRYVASTKLFRFLSSHVHLETEKGTELNSFAFLKNVVPLSEQFCSTTYSLGNTNSPLCGALLKMHQQQLKTTIILALLRKTSNFRNRRRNCLHFVYMLKCLSKDRFEGNAICLKTLYVYSVLLYFLNC